MVLTDKEIEDIIDICQRYYVIKEGLHGVNHIRRVVSYSKQIAEIECPERLKDVIIAAALHDVGRVDDSGGNQHAIDGSRLAQKIVTEHWPDAQVQDIVYAIEFHADDLQSDDPMIGAVWDADRLDLERAGIVVRESQLSTQTGKKILSMRDAF